MNVLHVYRTYFPDSQGGVQEAIRQIARSTKRHGVVNRIFTPSQNPVPTLIASDEGDIVRVKQHFEIASCGFALTCLAEFRRQLDWADIVHFHYPWPFGDLLHLMSRSSLPTLVTYHSDIVRQELLSIVYRPVMDRFLDSIDKIIATSPNYYKSSDVLQRYREKVETIPLGIDESFYPDPSRNPELLANVEQAFGRDFFLFVGVWRYYKGLHLLLDAAKDAKFRVVIVGDGPENQRIRDQAKSLGLNNVIMPGYVDDQTKMALLSLCRALVMPSHLRSEAFGVTLLEGAMHSKPLVSAEVGSGTTHVNIDQQTGHVITANSVESLRKAMNRLHENSAEAAKMGVQARQRFDALFTGEITGNRYLAAYQSLLGKNIEAASLSDRAS